MKTITSISCASHASTSIVSASTTTTTTTMDPSPSTASIAAITTIGGSVGGGRAIDRHNPIITDEKRRSPPTPATTPATPRPPQKEKESSPRKKSKKKVKGLNGSDHVKQSVGKLISYSGPSDLIVKGGGCKAAKPGDDFISPPESSRYLLGSRKEAGSVSNGWPEFDPVLKLDPNGSTKKGEAVNKADVSRVSKSAPSNSTNSDQVVVLRVSLHCRGCERKMRKHLSRMAGVTSFNIDFAAKKVTVVGDVTPLGVLSSISKVKNAQFWAPPMSSSSPFGTRNIQLMN